MYYNQSYHELWSKKVSKGLLRSTIKLPVSVENSIENFFIVNNESEESSPTIILPDLSAHIIIHRLKNDKLRIRVVGPRSKSIIVNHKERKQTFIMRFKPSSFIGFSNLHQSELVDKSFDFCEIFGHDSRSIIEFALNSNSNNNLIFNTIFKELTKKKYESNCNTKLTDAFICLLNSRLTNITVKSAAEVLGVSERYLLRKVKEQLGVSPKSAIKLNRLTTSLKIRQANTNLPWSQIAIHSGYYDQSHMIDEYQQFLNNTPGKYI